MSWKCKKCGSINDITVIKTINYHNCKLDSEGSIVDCPGAGQEIRRATGVKIVIMNLKNWKNWRNGRVIKNDNEN